MSPLLNCPFCGGRAEYKQGIYTGYVVCLCCEVMGPNIAEAEAIAAWNRRAHPLEDAADTLRHHLLEDDHERGCQGRCYTCACGYDDETYRLAAELIAPAEWAKSWPAGGWIDIATAPGDRPFLALDAFWAVKRVWLRKFSDGSQEVVGWDDAKPFKATHWLPLPTPPEQSAAGHPVAVDGGTQEPATEPTDQSTTPGEKP